MRISFRWDVHNLDCVASPCCRINSAVTELTALSACYQPWRHCTLCPSSWSSGSCKLLPNFQYYLQFCLLLCHAPKGWRSKDFPHALHLETMIAAPACSQDKWEWKITWSIAHGERWLCYSIRQQWSSLTVQLEGSCRHRFLANETCDWHRGGVSPESCGVGWLSGRVLACLCFPDNSEFRFFDSFKCDHSA